MIEEEDLRSLGILSMPHAEAAVAGDIWLQVRGFVDLTAAQLEPSELAQGVLNFAEQSMARRLSDVLSTEEFGELVETKTADDLTNRIPFLWHTVFLERSQAVAQMWLQFGPAVERPGQSASPENGGQRQS